MSLPRRTLWTDVDLDATARRLLEPEARIVTGSAENLAMLEEAEGVIVGSLLPANPAFFARAPKLEVIARVGMGFDNLDLVAATAAGVCAVNTPGAPTESTAEFTVGLLLAVARRIALADHQLRAVGWEGPAKLQGFDLAGKTLGLIGCGRIGRRVAELALAFHMRVIAFDPAAASIPAPIERVPELEALLSAADVVSLHLPLNPGTRHLLNERTFARMKRGAIVLNTSRGPVVDEPALIAALTSGHLGGAGIDVWDPEPIRGDHPLLRLPNTVVTPHMAAYTTEGRGRSHGAAAAQVLDVWNGKRPNALLNPEVSPHRRRAR